MLCISQDGWGIVVFWTLVLCAGFAVGASTERSVRRHGSPSDGSSLIVDKPQVPAGISYSSQRTNIHPNVKKSCDIFFFLAENVRVPTLSQLGREWMEYAGVLDGAVQPTGEVDPLLQKFKNVTRSSLVEKNKARALKQRCELLIAL